MLAAPSESTRCMVRGKVAKPSLPWPEFVDSWPDQYKQLLLDPPDEQEVLAEDWKAVKGEKDEAPHVVPRLSPKDLREFVEGVIANRYFLSAQIRESEGALIKNIFMPLALGALSSWSKEELLNIGIIYEEYSSRTQASRSINGYPIFFSCRLMHKDDWAKADAAIRKALKAQRDVLVELEDRETEIG